jgi:hypothetical protein
MHISAHPVYKMSLFLHISFTEGNFSRALRILAYFLQFFCIFVNTYAYLCIFPNCIFFVHFSTYLYIFVHIYAYIFHVCCILNAYFMHISTYSCILLVCSLHVYWHIYCIFIAYSQIFTNFISRFMHFTYMSDYLILTSGIITCNISFDMVGKE